MAKGSSRFAAAGILIVVVGLLGAVLVAPGATGSGGAQAAAKTITVGDNFFAPSSTKSKKRKKVKFNWTGSNPHNITLKKGPGKKFKSKTTSSTGVNYKRKFKKRGTYEIFCTIHPVTMNLTLTVK